MNDDNQISEDDINLILDRLTGRLKNIHTLEPGDKKKISDIVSFKVNFFVIVYAICRIVWVF